MIKYDTPIVLYVETLALLMSDSCIHVHYNDCLKWYTCTVYVLANLFLLYILAKQYANCTHACC